AHDLEWTRGSPRRFASSNKAWRGFCPDCGTPLTFETDGRTEIAVRAFDDPSVVPPTIQVNPADKALFFDGICALPTRKDGAEPNAEAFKASVVSLQHPDHDTTQWPPEDRRCWPLRIQSSACGRFCRQMRRCCVKSSATASRS